MMQGSWGMGFGWPLMIIFWLVIIGGLVFFVMLLVHGRLPGNKSPLDILKKRFAKGEITKEEFERMKDELMKQ